MHFVVLHHTDIPSPHFDFLYETSPGSTLTTFRVPHWPPRVNDCVEELADHRRVYLEYEGPISGDRGSVSRVDAGTIETEDLSVDPPMFAIRLTSPQRRLDLMLMHTMETGWVVSSVKETEIDP